MIDKSIPYFNVIMRYDGPKAYGIPELPVGYSFSNYQEGDDVRWAQMEVDNNDFDTYQNALNYFKSKYLQFPVKLLHRFIGVRDEQERLVGSVICWEDDRNGDPVSSVHWLVTDPSVQGKGIGTALAKMLVLNFCSWGLLPIYLHTQPWSYTAIGIYSEVGFKLLKMDSFRGYKNQTKEALPVLEKHMARDKYTKLINEMI